MSVGETDSRAMLIAALGQALVRQPREVQELYFLADEKFDHPVWSDNTAIVLLACRQILGAAPLRDDDPLAFIGFHARNRFTGSRYSMGWVITDERVVAQDDFGLTSSPPPPTVVPITANASPEILHTQLWRSFDSRHLGRAQEMSAESLSQALLAALEAVLPPLKAARSLPFAPATASSLKDRVIELGLSTIVQWPTDHAKLIGKLSKKLGTHDVTFAVADSVLFGGAYGLAVTASGVVSVDLMESPVTSTWADIQQNPMTADATPDGLVAGEQRHVVPKHEGAARQALATLINELAVGLVS